MVTEVHQRREARFETKNEIWAKISEDIYSDTVYIALIMQKPASNIRKHEISNREGVLRHQMETEMADIEHTWKKVENTSRKTGLRDGISDGQESNFQKSFDMGFQEGFKNGFLLGKHKGILLAESQQTATDTKTNPLLEKLSRGSCEICQTGKSLDEVDIEKLVDDQRKVYEANVKTLSSISNEESSGF